MNKIAIATPTYNEAKNIRRLILDIEKVCKDLPDYSFSLFIIDDNSPDNTAQLARDTAESIRSKSLDINIITRPYKQGIGAAYIYGFRHILRLNYDFIIQMDADLSHNPKYIKDMTNQASKGIDFVSTSRYMNGGRIDNWTMHRRLVSYIGNVYARILLGNKISDYTGGLNMFSTKLLKRIGIDNITSGGYGFFIELKYTALQHTNNYSQIPIVFTDRKHGKSKIPKNTIIVSFLLVSKLRKQLTK